MTKYVTIKESNTQTNRDAFASFWEQMLLDKIEKYHLHHLIQPNYEVVKETEKAFCIKVEANDMFTASGNDYLGKDWEVWMPKKAMIGY